MKILSKQFPFYVLILFCTLAIYSNHFHNAFHFDDAHTIVENVSIRDIHNIGQFFTDTTMFSSLPQNQTYRPMTTLSTAVDYLVAGELNPYWFHVSTFSWFMLQLFIMFKLYQHLFKTHVDKNHVIFLSFITRLIYALHPVNAETINYISARSDALSTCWLVLAFYSYIAFPSLRKWGLHLFCFVIAVLFKATTIVYPILLYLYMFLYEQKITLKNIKLPEIRKKLYKEILPLCLTTIIVLILLAKMTPSSYNPGGSSSYQYFITQPYVISHYLFSFFCPTQLSADTDWLPLKSILDKRALFGFLFIVLLLYASYKASKYHSSKLIAFGFFWFIVALIPTSNFIPLAEVKNDHRLFFPYVGLTPAFVYCAYLVVVKFLSPNIQPKLLKILLIFILLLTFSFFSILTVERNRIWKTEETLWKDVTMKSPKNGRGLMNYGLVKMRQGDFKTAEDYFHQALNYVPYYSYLHVNLAVLYEKMNQSDKALFYYQNALKFDSRNYIAHTLYANYLINNDKLSAESLRHVNQALKLSPRYMQAHYLLLSILYQQQKYESLVNAINQILTMNLDDKTAKNYQRNTHNKLVDASFRAFQQHDFLRSIKTANLALKLSPDSFVAYNNICASFNQLAKFDKAKMACEKALYINPHFQQAALNLAVTKKALRP